jgi:hypothetical protein
MRRKIWLLALVGAVLLSGTAAGADDFYVIGARVAQGTNIIKLPLTINAPGYYYLTGNLTYTGGTGIIVNADNVTIDLMGFVLTGASTSGAGTGISLGAKNNVEVRNGTVTGWTQAVDGSGAGQRAIGIRAVDNANGINFSGSDGLIKGCTASQGSFGSGWGLGVSNGIISGCTVMDFTPTSPTGNLNISVSGTASDNVVLNCTGTGIRSSGSSTLINNSVINCDNGIDTSGGGSMIANAVAAIASGQNGLIFGVNPVVADQNSFYAADGATWYTGSFFGHWGVNGFPY